MRDIVPNDIAYKERRQPDAHDGIDQVEPVVGLRMKAACEQRHDGIDEAMQNVGCHRREQSNHKSQDEQKHLVAHVGHTPFVQSYQPRCTFYVMCFVFHSDAKVQIKNELTKQSAHFFRISGDRRPSRLHRQDVRHRGHRPSRHDRQDHQGHACSSCHQRG